MKHKGLRFTEQKSSENIAKVNGYWFKLKRPKIKQQQNKTCCVVNFVMLHIQSTFWKKEIYSGVNYKCYFHYKTVMIFLLRKKRKAERNNLSPKVATAARHINDTNTQLTEANEVPALIPGSRQLCLPSSPPQPPQGSCRTTVHEVSPSPCGAAQGPAPLPVHCGQQESWVREGFSQSSGGHTSVSHSTRPLWQVHWVHESMFHVSPSTKYSPPGAWQMEGVLSSGFCTTKSSGKWEKMRTQEVIQRQSHHRWKKLVLSAWRDREEVVVEYLPLLLSRWYWRNIPCTETEGKSRRAGFKKWSSSGSSLSTVMTDFNKGIQLPREDSSCREENRAS